MSKLKMCFISYPNKEKASIAAEYIVKNNIAACVKILEGITSYYIFEGKFEKDEEVYLIAKTIEENVDSLQIYLKDNHPYKVYEFLSVDADSINSDYFKWIKENTSRKI